MPNKRELHFKRRRKDRSGAMRSTYMCHESRGCPFFGLCTKNPRGREIRVYDNIDVLYKMRKKLDSPEGKNIYRKRKTIIEPVFGNIKHNLRFREFLLRGLNKVKAEFALIAIVHNIGKIAKVFRKKTLHRQELIPLPAT